MFKMEETARGEVKLDVGDDGGDIRTEMTPLSKAMAFKVTTITDWVDQEVQNADNQTQLNSPNQGETLTPVTLAPS